MPDYAVVKNKKTPRLVVVESGNRYTQYIGKLRNISIISSVPLSDPQLEAYRKNPAAFLALEEAIAPGGEAA